MSDPGETSWDGRNDGPQNAMAPSGEQARIQAATYSPIMSRSAIRSIRPPLPQIRLNPKRHGYSQRTLGITDILDVNRDYEPRIDWSGGIGAYTATSRNALGAI